MKIAIIGYGQMGHMIEQCAQERGHQVVSLVDPFAPQAQHQEITPAALAEAEVAICFTRPDVALDNIQRVLATKTPLVMGTTGWTEQMPQVKELVEQAGVGMVYSSNFSIGVNIFFKIIQEAALVMDQFEMYDIMAYELHHNKKRDSPSGTARTMAQMLIERIARKKRLVEDRIDRMIEPDELQFASIRGGSIPGTHAVVFDSEFDSIELKHTARTRKGFATGAVIAGEWILGKRGLFTEQDMMTQMLA